MLRYFLGIITALLFISSVCGMLYIFDQGDIVDLKPSVIFALSQIPGWEEVADAYRLGLVESKYLAEERRIIQEKTAVLEERSQRLLETEGALELAKRQFELEKARYERSMGANPSPAVQEEVNNASPESVARLLEAMKPEQAGQNLLKLPFEQGLAVLGIIEPRRAGKILETLPADKSARYLEKMTIGADD